jgi:hypothetical protein
MSQKNVPDLRSQCDTRLNKTPFGAIRIARHFKRFDKRGLLTNSLKFPSRNHHLDVDDVKHEVLLCY